MKEKKKSSSFITNWVIFLFIIGIIGKAFISFVPLSPFIIEYIPISMIIYWVIVVTTILAILTTMTPKDKTLF